MAGSQASVKFAEDPASPPHPGGKAQRVKSAFVSEFTAADLRHPDAWGLGNCREADKGQNGNR